MSKNWAKRRTPKKNANGWRSDFLGFIMDRITISRIQSYLWRNSESLQVTKDLVKLPSRFLFRVYPRQIKWRRCILIPPFCLGNDRACSLRQTISDTKRHYFQKLFKPPTYCIFAYETHPNLKINPFLYNYLRNMSTISLQEKYSCALTSSRGRQVPPFLRSYRVTGTRSTVNHCQFPLKTIWNCSWNRIRR